MFYYTNMNKIINCNKIPTNTQKHSKAKNILSNIKACPERSSKYATSRLHTKTTY